MYERIQNYKDFFNLQNKFQKYFFNIENHKNISKIQN